MDCLYIDASRDRLSVGFVSGSLWVTRERIEGRHDAVLLESIRELCAECNLSVSDIDRCVVVNGPGSFTGLRIAVSCIHALDLVTPLQVLPVDQLSLVAEAAQSSHGAILDARMDEVYVGLDRQADGTFGSLQLKPVNKLSPDDTWICHHEEQDRFAVELIPVIPSLQTLRDLALQMDSSRWIDGHRLTPRYVRQTVSWKPLAEQPSKLYDR